MSVSKRERAERAWRRLAPSEQAGISERAFARAVGISASHAHTLLAEWRPRAPGPEQANGHRPAPAGATIDLERLDAALGLLPEPLRSTFLAALAAIVARWHLATQLPSQWPAFNMLGPTGTGKSLVMILLARVLGLDEREVIREVTAESDRSLLGRHTARGFDPATYLGAPLLGLDEGDKPGGERKLRNVNLLLQGVTSYKLGGRLLALRPTVVMATNLEAPERIPSDRRRRAFTCSTVPLRGHRGELKVAGRELLGSRGLFPPGGPPAVPLEAARPPADEVSPDAISQLEGLLEATLTDEALDLTDTERAARLVLGYQALGYDELGATWSTAATLAVMAASSGGTRPGWREVFAEGPGWAREIIAGALEPPAPRDRRELARRGRAGALEVAGSRGALVWTIRAAQGALGELPRSYCQRAGWLDGQLEQLRRDAAELEEPEDLAQLAADVRPALEDAAALVAEARGDDENQGADDEWEEWEAAGAVSESTTVRVLEARRPEPAVGLVANLAMVMAQQAAERRLERQAQAQAEGAERRRVRPAVKVLGVALLAGLVVGVVKWRSVAF